MIEQWYYLLALLVSIAGLATLDWQHQLAFWHDWRRTLKTIGVGIAIFVVWDLFGIGLGIFFHGGSQYTLPVRLLPELPIEELFFLFLLCYVTLLLYRGVPKLWPRI